MSAELMTVETVMLAFRRRRESLGISRQKLGDAAGYNMTQIKRWENGKERPSVAAVAHLSIVLGGHLEITWDDRPATNSPLAAGRRLANLSAGRKPRKFTDAARVS